MQRVCVCFSRLQYVLAKMSEPLHVSLEWMVQSVASSSIHQTQNPCLVHAVPLPTQGAVEPTKTRRIL